MDHTIFRPASFIELALHNLSNALILGSVLVFVILILFLFEWRTALISLVAIPLSLMAAAMVLWARDVDQHDGPGGVRDLGGGGRR